ncbi:hypothetical protein [Mycobacteroides abscessus]|uniref:hypothetical protein n=1 Tax=Mycobacteroides abscessus TaxID=36809 RepID=UPI000927BA5B|nr:hypothetical protein [Mycobacteroides abscessus]SIG33297.1 Uncharacterised protein [Mycobacteroides abscessus subsp. abscessus]SIG44710.1 Uncharacterised protein [Mycobacteroides abscessus subsp. abscessus]SIM97388.1 Uncharacterised protein [Mycobacteroides abscessus subsp. abscessus]SIN10172.1 Uncharacterised protein [Mycobacteroides abscessus subsp. abscessus]SIN15581.1 Uncharacterised protein [Mycobacteroides abscessus subsp. abscessus]
MSTDYRDLITSPATSIHDNVRSAQTRLRGVVELLEHAHGTGTDGANFTAAIDDLRAVERRLAEAVRP